MISQVDIEQSEKRLMLGFNSIRNKIAKAARFELEERERQQQDLPVHNHESIERCFMCLAMLYYLSHDDFLLSGLEHLRLLLLLSFFRPDVLPYEKYPSFGAIVKCAHVELMVWQVARLPQIVSHHPLKVGCGLAIAVEMQRELLSRRKSLHALDGLFNRVDLSLSTLASWSPLRDSVPVGR